MQVRWSKNDQLLGYSDEVKVGFDRVAGMGPLQKKAIETSESGVVSFDVRFVMHEETGDRGCRHTCAIYVDAPDDALCLPGFRTIGAFPASFKGKKKRSPDKEAA